MLLAISIAERRDEMPAPTTWRRAGRGWS